MYDKADMGFEIKSCHPGIHLAPMAIYMHQRVKLYGSIPSPPPIQYMLMQKYTTYTIWMHQRVKLCGSIPPPAVCCKHIQYMLMQKYTPYSI